MCLKLKKLSCLILTLISNLFVLPYSIEAANQTPTVSPIFPETSLPFTIKVELVKKKNGEPFLLSPGIQSYNTAKYQGEYLFVLGRTNGLHGFNNDPNNFPPSEQNRTFYVVDFENQVIHSRSLLDPSSGLTLDQIESLSATAAQGDQVKDTLYLCGGYGFRTAVNNFTTFDTLTALDLPGVFAWVKKLDNGCKLSSFIRQTNDPTFQITGGDMHRLGERFPTLLVMGNKFEGAYFQPGSVQEYSEQIRRFYINDDGKTLDFELLPPLPANKNPNYHRRDLNVVPVLFKNAQRKLLRGLVALSGVFTPGAPPGIWTVPVSITPNGTPSMADPLNPTTFKQGMNNYISPTIGLFSCKTGNMFVILLGGITYGFFENGVFKTDDKFPFTDQITTVKINADRKFSQYLMNAEYPVILSTQANQGNRLLFGASAEFIPSVRLSSIQFGNGIFQLDKICEPLLLGYIVGGIQSTLPNTNTMSDSSVSPYIFKVTLFPKKCDCCKKPSSKECECTKMPCPKENKCIKKSCPKKKRL